MDSVPTKKLKVLQSSVSQALEFRLYKKFKKARKSLMILPHGEVDLPIFMPVGTKGTIKGLTSEEMTSINCKILLANTYHLASKPSTPFIKEFGGLHKFMKWPGNILTDSGGFQMVSLSKLSSVDEESVIFTHPSTGEILKLRPEDSIIAQNEIGSDIMMALDDVVATTTIGDRMNEAQQRTMRWIHRCFSAHGNQQKQNLFPIVQGGLDPSMRKECAEYFAQLDAPGYAIGGLSGGEEKKSFLEIVEYTASLLPENKPRYLMGVGFPVDLVLCASLGVDMFDCVYPTRTARFGTGFSKTGNIRLTNSEFATDLRPIDEGCTCETCTYYTRAYLHTIARKEEVGAHMISKHNIHFLLTLLRGLQQSIEDENLDEYVRIFLKSWYSTEKELPDWVLRGLELAEISSEDIF